MKTVKKLLCALVTLGLLLALSPAASAEDDRFAGKTWDQVIEEFNARYDVKSDRVAYGYRNLVTGEEHFLNGDKYMVAASMFKVPLCMIIADKVQQGELDWSTDLGGISVKDLMEGSIINSNNAYAEQLWRYVGHETYRSYREIMAPYVGEDAATVDPKYYENNFHTAEQFIYALNLLYSEPDRFPLILDTMKRAEPFRYFKLAEQRYDIAHKYGFLASDYHTVINDMGIAFTDEPIALVVFTDNQYNAYDVLTAYCTLMCDYTQYHAARHREMDEALDKAVSGLKLGLKLSPTAAVSQETEAEKTAEDTFSADLFSFTGKVAIAAAILLLLAALLAIVRASGSRILTALVGLVLAAAVLVCGVLVSSRADLLSRGGDAPAAETGEEAEQPGPKTAANNFFANLERQDYNGALTLLREYGRLGLEEDAADPLDQAALEGLRANFRHEITGPAEISGSGAVLPVRLSYLDLKKLEKDLPSRTKEILRSMGDRLSEDEFLDADGSIKAELVQQAALDAIGRMLNSPEHYSSFLEYEMNLVQRFDQWYVQGSNELDTALTGGQM